MASITIGTNLKLQELKFNFILGSIRWTKKSQVTSQIIDLQTDFLGVENRRWVLSNLNSRPIIQSQQVSNELNYVKPSWFINANVYYKCVGGITKQGQGFQNQFQFLQEHSSYYKVNRFFNQ